VRSIVINPRPHGSPCQAAAGGVGEASSRLWVFAAPLVRHVLRRQYVSHILPAVRPDG